MSVDHPTPAVSPYIAGVRSRCPRCGRGGLYDGYLTLAEKCGSCELGYDFADAGDGPAVFVIMITGFLVVFAALVVEILFQPSYWVHGVLWLPLAVALPLIFLRPFKSLLIALQYKHQAREGRRAS